MNMNAFTPLGVIAKGPISKCKVHTTNVIKSYYQYLTSTKPFNLRLKK